MNSDRDITIDIVSGIFILRMVYTHTSMFAEFSNHTFLFGITGMFLLWFFFKGGMLAKEDIPFEKVCQTSWKKLLKPYICLTFIALLGDSLLYMCDRIAGGGYYVDNELIRTMGSIVLNGSAHGNMPIWFLLSYFFVRLFFAFQQRYFAKVTPYLFLVIGIIVPFMLYFLPFRYPYYLANIWLGVFGYYAGYIYKRNANCATIIGLVSAILYFGIFIFCKSSLDIRTNHLYSGYYLLWGLWSISGCIFYISVIKKSRYLLRFLNKVGLSWFGKASMSILVLHWPILLIANIIDHYISIPESYKLVYYFGVMIVTFPPICYVVKNSKWKFLIGY